jgi:hypothetical protein
MVTHNPNCKIHSLQERMGRNYDSFFLSLFLSPCMCLSVSVSVSITRPQTQCYSGLPDPHSGLIDSLSLFSFPYLPISSRSLLPTVLSFLYYIVSWLLPVLLFIHFPDQYNKVPQVEYSNRNLLPRTWECWYGLQGVVVDTNMLIFLSCSDLSLFPQHLALHLAQIRFSVNERWMSQILLAFIPR